MSWPQVWTHVAEELSTSWGAGLERLVTEDVIRFATVKALVANGVPTKHLEAEWRAPGVPTAVDLVVTQSPRAAIEFKFPREPREKNAAWTQHLGETLKDFYRLADMSSDFQERWCVQLISPRFRQYLTGVGDRLGVRIAQRPGHCTELRPDDVRGLPKTAHNIVAPWLGTDAQPVRAMCVGSYPVGDSHLVIHDVEPRGATVG